MAPREFDQSPWNAFELALRNPGTEPDDIAYLLEQMADQADRDPLRVAAAVEPAVWPVRSQQREAAAIKRLAHVLLLVKADKAASAELGGEVLKLAADYHGSGILGSLLRDGYGPRNATPTRCDRCKAMLSLGRRFRLHCHAGIHRPRAVPGEADQADQPAEPPTDQPTDPLADHRIAELNAFQEGGTFKRVAPPTPPAESLADAERLTADGIDLSPAPPADADRADQPAEPVDQRTAELNGLFELIPSRKKTVCKVFKLIQSRPEGIPIRELAVTDDAARKSIERINETLAGKRWRIAVDGDKALFEIARFED